jgi:hypothetical protein
MTTRGGHSHPRQNGCGARQERLEVSANARAYRHGASPRSAGLGEHRFARQNDVARALLMHTYRHIVAAATIEHPTVAGRELGGIVGRDSRPSSRRRSGQSVLSVGPTTPTAGPRPELSLDRATTVLQPAHNPAQRGWCRRRGGFCRRVEKWECYASSRHFVLRAASQLATQRRSRRGLSQQPEAAGGPTASRPGGHRSPRASSAKPRFPRWRRRQPMKRRKQ